MGGETENKKHPLALSRRQSFLRFDFSGSFFFIYFVFEND